MFVILQVTGPPWDTRNLKNFLHSQARIRLILSRTSSPMYFRYFQPEPRSSSCLRAGNTFLGADFSEQICGLDLRPQPDCSPLA